MWPTFCCLNWYCVSIPKIKKAMFNMLASIRSYACSQHLCEVVNFGYFSRIHWHVFFFQIDINIFLLIETRTAIKAEMAMISGRCKVLCQWQGTTRRRSSSCQHSSLPPKCTWGETHPLPPPLCPPSHIHTTTRNKTSLREVLFSVHLQSSLPKLSAHPCDNIEEPA